MHIWFSICHRSYGGTASGDGSGHVDQLRSQVDSVSSLVILLMFVLLYADVCS